MADDLIVDKSSSPQYRTDNFLRFDEFYDRNVKVALSAAESLPNLYSGERLAFEFERTKSRLLEMQSHEYLARPHCP